ncbi:hypothetical protein AKG07_16695 [Microbacterium sp. CGR1]|nr:hypothetical protein AKG07_16695 [Microbacterium sp. CGR1]
MFTSDALQTSYPFLNPTDPQIEHPFADVQYVPGPAMAFFHVSTHTAKGATTEPERALCTADVSPARSAATVSSACPYSTLISTS